MVRGFSLRCWVRRSGVRTGVDRRHFAPGIRAARAALVDLPQVEVVTGSVRRVLAVQPAGADLAVLDPPRSGAGREVVDLLAGAGVPRLIHIGCEAASFARDIGLYRGHGYALEKIKVFDAFPLTHYVECVALLTRKV
ncbi:hypothetical protein RN09_3278 [Mycobacterium tuberculosis variant africanum]|nr:hypothetical protein RN09_3278 [Mycobacterium tuberculosis variant africanum]